MPEPRHDPGGFGGIRRRDVLSDQRIDQSGFACVKSAGDSHPDRLVEPGGDTPQFVVRLCDAQIPRIVLIGEHGVTDDDAGLCDAAHTSLVALRAACSSVGCSLSTWLFTWRRMCN
ncbi:Uncharacterised protein [Mycobacteroides abscessus subsp. abscessus]|nr:Uncharacterised protein [Mycobacteroides abscessus subsp. abscessus]